MNSPIHTAWHDELVSHVSWLRSIVRARCGEAQAVEDVLSDVLADALAIRDPQSVKETGPWLYRLAVRKALLFRRKCGRQKRAYRAKADQLQTQSATNPSQTPLDFVLHDEKLELVQRALSRLNGKDAEILMLKYVHEWNYKKISHQLGIDYWKVVHRLRKARERMKVQLSQLMQSEK